MKQSFSFKGHTFIKRTLIVNTDNILIEVTDPKQNIKVYKKTFEHDEKQTVANDLRHTLIEWLNDVYTPPKHVTLSA